MQPITSTQNLISISLYMVCTIVYRFEVITCIFTQRINNEDKISNFRIKFSLVLDFVFLLFSIADIAYNLVKGIPFLIFGIKVRVFRVLRLLGSYSQEENDSMERKTFYRVILELFKLLIIVLILLIFFGVVAVTYLKGSLFYCTYEVNTQTNNDVSETDCMDFGGD